MKLFLVTFKEIKYSYVDIYHYDNILSVLKLEFNKLDKYQQRELTYYAAVIINNIAIVNIEFNKKSVFNSKIYIIEELIVANTKIFLRNEKLKMLDII